MKQTLFVLFLPLVLIGLALTPRLKSQQDIDYVLASPAYNRVHPVTDAGWSSYRRQVADRLEYLEELLLSRDVRSWPKELQVERAENIERLHNYRKAERFPINYDHPEEQLPCFLDREGNLCAVAYLISESAGMDLVREINSKYQYATVSEMKLNEIDQWIAASGLTREEIITIQEPGFTQRPVLIEDLLKSSTFVQIPDTLSLYMPVDSTQLYRIDSTSLSLRK
ncbi:MAG: hypothetical protein AB7H80_04180 [Candidatus Kapaibacterium sp.]